MSGQSLAPSPRQLWRRWRALLAIALLIVLLGAIHTWVQAQIEGGRMDPHSARDEGARALSVLLEERGVQVERVEQLAEAMQAAGPDSTLLVTAPDLLEGARAKQLARTRARHVVLFGPGEEVLRRLAPGVNPAGTAFADTRQPECRLPAARRAGAIETTGQLYRVSESGRGMSCYGDDYRGALVRTQAHGRTVDIVGTPASFQNRELDQQGHAALALNLLGRDDRLVWFVPSLADVQADGQSQSLFGLLPDGIRAAIGMAGVAGVLVVLAAARRLGPVVTEQLPVVVRASETTEGRARLYRRTRAREQAATALRAAARARLTPRLGLSSNADDTELVAAVVAHLPGTTGWTPADVADALTGGVPSDDDALIALAEQLDSIEQEVRRT